jgi:hypothetical protein
MTRIHMTLTGLAVTVVAALGLGAPQAVAAPVAGVQQQASASPSAVSGADLPIHRGKDRNKHWGYHGMYRTLGDCHRAGQQGIARGHWQRYRCVRKAL